MAWKRHCGPYERSCAVDMLEVATQYGNAAVRRLRMDIQTEERERNRRNPRKTYVDSGDLNVNPHRSCFPESSTAESSLTESSLAETRLYVAKGGAPI